MNGALYLISPQPNQTLPKVSKPTKELSVLQKLLMFKKLMVPKKPPQIHAKLHTSDFPLYLLNKRFSEVHLLDFSPCFDPRNNALKSVRVRMKHLVYSVVLLREVGLFTCEWLAYTPLRLRRFIYTLFTFDWQVYTSPPLLHHVHLLGGASYTGCAVSLLRFTCERWERGRRRRCSGPLARRRVRVAWCAWCWCVHAALARSEPCAWEPGPAAPARWYSTAESSPSTSTSPRRPTVPRHWSCLHSQPRVTLEFKVQQFD